MTDTRAAFEAATKGERVLNRKSDATDAEYAYHSVEFAWQMWQAAIKAEREACAKVCEDMGGTMSMFANTSDARMHNNAVRGCAAAVRARSA